MGFLFGGLHKKKVYQKENATLSKLCNKLATDMDIWIVTFDPENVPGGEEQCAELEDKKIEELIEQYHTTATEELGRESEGEDDPISKKVGGLRLILENRKGRLFEQFAPDVSVLQLRAAAVLKDCVKALDLKETEVLESLPMLDSEVSAEFDELLVDLEASVEAKYPGGVAGIDGFDDELPDGIPSWADFKTSVETKKGEVATANEEAIAAAMDELTESSKVGVKEKINEAIKAAVEAIKVDLSDDTVPYLGEDAMAELRQTLIEAADEYGTSRLAE